jgi:hypothetical protein
MSDSYWSCRSEINWLKSIIEYRLGLREVVLSTSLSMLKSPIRTHGRSCIQVMMRNSCRNESFWLLSVGPYTFVSMS